MKELTSPTNELYLPSEMEKLKSLFPYIGDQVKYTKLLNFKVIRRSLKRK